jgi:hypothetical protein
VAHDKRKARWFTGLRALALWETYSSSTSLAAPTRSLGGPKRWPLIESSHALSVSSPLIGPPSSPVTATALRFGATYWASALYSCTRKLSSVLSSIAIPAIPSIGSQASAASFSATAIVLLLGVPFCRPPLHFPVLAPRGMTSFLYFSKPAE